MGLLSKKCTRCKEEKPLTKEHFPLHNRTKSGFDSWCRKCRGAYRSEIRRGSYRSSISDEDLKKMMKLCTSCAICGIEGNLVVDHNHTTLKIRGMLCTNCNLGLGHFKDNKDLLQSAISYLDQKDN